MTAWQETAAGMRNAVGGSNGHVEMHSVQGSMTQVRRTRWAWKDWAPLGCFLLIAGEPGQGKGVFTSYLLAGLTRGTHGGDLHGKPVNALWVGTEDSWEEVVLPRLAAAGADVDRVFKLVIDTPGHVLEVARDQAKLSEQVDAHDIRVIAFEAMVDHLTGDDHKNAEVRRGLAPLVELARERHLLAIGTTHLNKASGGTYRQRVSGSGGYLAVARVGLLVHRHPDNPDLRVVAFGKGNLGRVPDSICFEIEGVDVANPDDPAEMADVGVLANPYTDASLTVDEVLSHAKVDQGVRDDVVEFLQEFVADGRKQANDVFEHGSEEGFTKALLKKHKRKANVVSRRDQDVWWWQLKAAGDE
jgi:hypothetical protein